MTSAYQQGMHIADWGVVIVEMRTIVLRWYRTQLKAEFHYIYGFRQTPEIKSTILTVFNTKNSKYCSAILLQIW